MTDKPEVPALLVTVDDAAKLLNVSRTTVFVLMRGGELASLTIGRRRLIKRAEIERFIEERSKAGVQ